ncbi:MAG TPA: type IV pilus assembly protein PilM [Luteolibacter sp.]|nr:type IV pilus assembly protein PilM [Luteolibacter sp.]
MADTPATVALNIGSQRIGMAVFESSKSGGLVLKAYDSESIVSDPALDASRVSQTKIAIASLAQRLKVGKSKVRYAISGQAVITRFVKLPPLGGDNIEQLVTFEAQQQFPFPLNEVVWDYELIESPGEKEVVIVAIKSDALDEINAAVNESGLSTSEVDVAPMALFNAFRAAYGEPSESVLLIDIGARTTNLLYLEGKRFFTRSVGISGSAVTAAIAKEYGIPFVEAESQKVTNGLVALGGGHTEQLDESVAHLAGVIRNALTRLPAEIARTTNYYRSQHGGSAPSRVILAGGGANLPYALEFFQEKLNLPVEYFNPLGAFSVGKGVDASVLQREGHLMGELVGLGLRGIGKSTINIDLVPTVVEQARAADRRKPFLIGAAAALLLGVGAWAGLQWVAAGKAEEKLQSANDTKEQLDPIASEIRTLLEKENSIRKVATGFTTAEADHAFWYDLLAEVRGAFASDAVWVTDLEPLAAYLPPVEAKAGAAKKDATAPATTSGKSMIRPEFFSTGYGQSSLLPVESEGKAGAAPQPINTVNAIRLKGFWRKKNEQNQNMVSELLKKLRENPGSFTFSFPGPDGKPVNLKDEQIVKELAVAGTGPELAFPFEIILPLAREVKAK